MNPIRGTYDLYDQEMLMHVEVVNTLQTLAQAYNFTQIKTPILERVELFNRSTGQSSDIVQKEMYTFLDKGGREIALRPELTAGVVRSFISNKMYGQRKSQYKYFYYGEAFRYERPQKGRYRQFYQFGVEMFGDDTCYSDVEIIDLANSIIKHFNLEKKVVLKINTIGTAKHRKKYNEKLREYFSKYEDELCDDCKNRLKINPLRILDCKIDKNHKSMKDAPSLRENLSQQSIEKYEVILNSLRNLNINYEEDDTLVRGLDYYNDIVFEFVYNNTYTLIGGGRYDGLLEQLGDQKLPAIGFGVGIERLIEAIKKENQNIEENYINKIDIMYVGLTPLAYPLILKSMSRLRLEGVICSCVFNRPSLKTNIKEAVAKKALYMIIIGEEELNSGLVTVKNLITKEEQVVDLKAFEDEVLLIND